MTLHIHITGLPFERGLEPTVLLGISQGVKAQYLSCMYSKAGTGFCPAPYEGANLLLVEQNSRTAFGEGP